VSGTVPATLSLSVSNGSLGSFTPGVAREHETTMQATVISTAGGALLNYTGPGVQRRRDDRREAVDRLR
jgi:hypothetical protein